MELQQAVHHTVLFGSFFVHLFQKVQAIDAMNKSYIIYYVLYLVGLQMIAEQLDSEN